MNNISHVSFSIVHISLNSMEPWITLNHTYTVFGLTFQLSFVYLLNYLTHAMQSRLLNFILAIVSVRWIVVNINRSFFFTTKPLFLIIVSTFVGVWCGDIYLLFISPNFNCNISRKYSMDLYPVSNKCCIHINTIHISEHLNKFCNIHI